MGLKDLQIFAEQESDLANQGQAVNQSLLRGLDENPDEYAKLLKISAQTGIAPPLAREYRPELEKRQRIQALSVDDLVRSNPKTARFLSNPDNAAVAQDDVSGLSTIEQVLLKPVDYVRAAAEGVIGKGAGSTLSGAGELYGVASRSLEALLDKALPNSAMSALRTPVPWFLDPEQVLKRPGTTLKAAGEYVAPPKERQGLDTDVASGIGQIGFQIASYLTTGGALSTASLYSQGADVMATKTAKDKGVGPLGEALGMTPGAARDTAIVSGAAITALTEKYGLDRILNRVPPEIKNRTLRFIADKVAAGGIEAGQEIAEGLLHDLTRKVLTDENAPILEGALQEGTAAGLSAAIVRAALGVRGYRQAKQQEEIVKALSGDSKLRDRLPEKYQEFVADITKGGPVQNAYIPVEQFQTFFQSQGVDPEQIADQIGATNYREALAAGSEVVIPIDKFAANVAPTDYLQGLIPDIKFDQGSMTPRERQEYMADMDAREAELEAKMQALVDEQTRQGTLNQAIQEIVTDIEGQLRGAGYDASTAQSSATVMRGMAILAERDLRGRAQAEGREVTDEEIVTAARQLWARYGLTVGRQMPGVLTTRPTSDITLDPLLDALRAGAFPTDQQIFGRSLAEFVRDSGGLVPSGETRTADENMERRPFQKKLTQKDGMSLDKALEAAVQAGYFPGMTAGDLSEADFLNALDDDLRGGGRFSINVTDNNALAMRQAMNSLGEYLDSLGIDLAALDNRQVRALIEQARNTPELQGAVDQFYQVAQTYLQQLQSIGQAEYDAVVAQYQGTEQWMRAPNGNPTNLTERQWVQVRTPSFKAWFGDWEQAAADGGVWRTSLSVSKVVDENGEPMVVYHGTDTGGFVQFKAPGGQARGDLGIWTTPNKDMATSYVKKGRAKDMDLSNPTQADLESLGFEFQGEGGAFSYTDPYGDESEQFGSQDAALSDATYKFNSDREQYIGDTEPGVYAIFLNIRDAYETDFEGATWGGERPGQYVVLNEDGEQLSTDDGTMYFDLFDDANTFARENGGTVEPAPDHFETTDGAVREARQNRNDGAIIRNVVDDGGGVSRYIAEPSDVFVALDPGQVKSADFNVGTFQQTSDNILYQGDVIGEGEVKRVLRREPGEFDQAEQAAFDEFLATRSDADRIMANLAEHKGTPWARQAVEGIFTRQAMRMLINGQEPTFQSSMDSTQVKRVRNVLSTRGINGLWGLLEADGGLMGGAAKPVNNVNSSFINCDPSADCAKYCYATKGNYQYANVIVKSELVTLAVELDPVRSAQRVAAEYKATAEFATNKALRLFDKGDGDMAWLPFIEELNRQGIRTQIFSKVPEFLRAVPDMNLKLLSIDDSNMDMADANPDLPVAFVYTGKSQIDMLAKLAARNQIQVVLPVKLGQKLLDGTEITDLKKAVPEVKPYLCPIDSGFKKLGKTSQQGAWNCTKCDVNGGVGCFHGKATNVVMKSLEAKPATQQERAQRILELRSQINAITAGTAGDLAQAGRLPPGGVEGLLREVDTLLGDLLRDYDTAPKTGATVETGSGIVDAPGVAEGPVPGRRVIPIQRLYQSDAGAAGGFDAQLNQGNELDDKRGFIQFNQQRKFNITLLEKADLSTFLHETGHFYLEVLGDLATAENAPEQIRNDYATVLKFLGLESRDQLTLDGKEKGSAEYNRAVEAHEKFARANEAYLMEGNAPSVELQGIFQRFKSWMLMVYRQMSALNVTLNNDVRAVLDRVYASDAEIEAAKNEVNVEALFIDATAAGMSAQEFELYRASVAKATEAGKDALTAKLMRQLMRERKEWWKEASAKMREEVTLEVDSQPVYQAFKALVTGKMDDDTEIKLNKQSLVDKYGAEYVKRLPRGFARIYSAQGGMDADTAAEFLGYNSGDALIEALVGMRDRKELIEAETDQRMRDTYGDMMTDGTLADEAKAALHNAERENLLMAELRALRRKQREVAPFVQAERDKARQDRRSARAAAEVPPAESFRRAARGIIGQTAARDTNANQYLLASRKAARQAFEAMSKGDYMLAAEAKQRELLNHHLYLEAGKAKEQAEKILKYAQKFEKGTTREQMGKAGGTYLEQIDAILDRYEFRRVPLSKLERRQSLSDWIAEQEAAGLEPSIDPVLINDARQINYRQLSNDELAAIYDAVRNIEHLARLKNKLMTKQADIEFADAIAELVAAAENMTAGKGDKPIGQRKPLPLDMSALTMREKAGDTVSRMDAMLVKMEQIVEWLDNGNVNGPWHTYLWNPISEAQTREYDLTRQLTERLAKSLEAMPKEQRLSMLDTFDVPGMGKVTRKFLISIALNMGNQGNIDKMMRGMNWDIATIEGALTRLNDADWTFVQDTWDTINSVWPEIAALEKRMTGLEPPKVEAQPYQVRDAQGNVTRTLAGGYYPLVYDPRKSEQGAKQETGNLGQLFEEGYVRATTPKGHTQARSEGFAAPMLLDFEQVVTQHMAKVVKDLTHREAVVQANKILTNREIRDVLQEVMGPAYEKQFLPWLRSVVNDRNGGSVQGLADMSRWMMTARANVVAAVMGFKATTAISQVTGLSQSLDKVKGRYLGQALLEFLRHPVALTRQVRELSGEMRNRSNTLDRDIRDQLRNLTGQNSKWAQAQRFAFHGIAIMDTVVTVPTWMGAYRQALDEGASEETARLEADAAVRMTQGAGGAKDLAAIQRNNELAKSLTMFYSYFNVLYNRMRDMGRDVQEIRDMPRFLSRVFFTVMVPAVVADLMLGRGPDDDEDPAAWTIRKVLLYPMMSIPVLRDVVSAMDSGFDYRFSPMATVFEKIGKAATATGKLVQGDIEWGEYSAKVAETMGYVFGVAGTAQMAATGKYLWRVSEGEENPENIAELLAYALLGKRKKD